MAADQVARDLRDLALEVVLHDEVDHAGRRAAAAHIGIDLAKEWAITEEYLHKKTKAEILKMGEDLGFFAEEKVKTFLFEKLLKKRGRFDLCKKSELVRLFTESGVDLVGRVPEEVLAAEDD